MLIYTYIYIHCISARGSDVYLAFTFRIMTMTMNFTSNTTYIIITKAISSPLLSGKNMATGGLPYTTHFQTYVVFEVKHVEFEVNHVVFEVKHVVFLEVYHTHHTFKHVLCLR